MTNYLWGHPTIHITVTAQLNLNKFEKNNYLKLIAITFKAQHKSCTILVNSYHFLEFNLILTQLKEIIKLTKETDATYNGMHNACQFPSILSYLI